MKGLSKLACRNARLELYVRRVCGAWDASQVSGVTNELNRAFAEEEKYCLSIESRGKYIYFGVDSNCKRNSVVKMAHDVYDEIDPHLFTLRCCDSRMHRHKKLEGIQRKVDVCRHGKLSVLNARHFLKHMPRTAESLVVDENVTSDVVSMARHCLSSSPCACAATRAREASVERTCHRRTTSRCMIGWWSMRGRARVTPIPRFVRPSPKCRYSTTGLRPP